MRISARDKVVLGLLTGVVAVGVLSFRCIDESRSTNYRALHAYPQGDMIEVGIGNNPDTAFNLSYKLYYTLGQEFPGARYIVPKKSSPVSKREVINRLLAFAQADNVSVEPYDPQAETYLDDTPVSLDVVYNHNEDESRLWILKEPGNERHAPWIVVVNRLYESQSPRKFIILEWDASSQPSNYDIVDLENSLWYHTGEDYGYGMIVLDLSLIESELKEAI